jgi:hypothetical protein
VLSVRCDGLTVPAEHTGADACLGRRMGPWQLARSVHGKSRLCGNPLFVRQPDRAVVTGHVADAADAAL